MGTNCSKDFPSPCEDNRCNQCEVSIGDRPDEPMEFFCTLAGAGGNSHRSDYCNKMSSAGEWEVGNQGDAQAGSCDYNDCNRYQEYSFGCCDGCCGISGEKLKCRRRSFTGDGPTCCLLDYNCSGTSYGVNGNTGLCFSDGFEGQQHTCADGVTGPNGEAVPNYRDVTTPDCRTALIPYCTGTLPTDDPNSTAWIDRWTRNNGGRGSCAFSIRRNLFTNPPNQPCFVPPTSGITGVCNLSTEFPINSEGYFWARQLISATMARYAEQGFEIGTLPGFPGYNPFQDFLYDEICCPYPGLCQDGLDIACSSYNAQRLSLNPTVAQWCGCHLPTIDYERYSAQFNIPPECTPMCNRSGTIPIVGINADPVTCKQSVCIMDDVTVNLVNSQIGGGVDFNQICGNCPNGQCSCVVTSTEIDIENSTIGGNLVPINIGCGNNGTCVQLNPGPTGPEFIPVSCSATGAFNPYDEYEMELNQAQAEATKSSVFTTIIVIGGCLILIFLILWLFHPTAKVKTIYASATGTTGTVHTGTTGTVDTSDDRPFLNDSSGYTSIYSSSDRKDFLPSTPSTAKFLPDTSPYTSIHG